MAAKYVVAAKDKFQGVHNAVMGGGQQQAPSHWSTTTFECMEDNQICGQTCFCPCCTTSNVINKLDNNTAQYDCGLCAFITGASMCTRGGADAYWHMATRRQLMQRFIIKDEPYHQSCLYSIFCMPCSSCQVQRELKLRNDNAGGVCVGDNGDAFGQPPHTADYSTKLSDCTGKECVDATCCAPCMLGYMTTKLNDIDCPNPSQPITQAAGVDRLDGAECCAGLFGGAVVGYGMRREFMTRYNVGNEDALTACLISSFCAPCAAAQQRREMGIRGQWPGGIVQKEAPESVLNLQATGGVAQGVPVGNQQKSVGMV